jgi:hypothetical protein
MLEKPKLVRKKIGDRNYNIVTTDGKLVGNVVMTGEYGRDDYPWDWSLADGLYDQMKAAGAEKGVRTVGCVDAMRDAVDIMATYIAHYGLVP